ncbi:MAG: SDR family oxidoreductase [Firmicutes bacterium]|nr:SDR family oxidoreductase [Bacillota bacterium]
MDFTQKTVLITGAASGIGKGTAQAFLDRGANIAIVDINEDGLKTFLNENAAHSDRLLALRTDVTKSTEVNQTVTQVIKKWGRIDILVNSAGIYKQAMLVDMTDEFWDQTQKVNMYGTFYFCRAVAREMIKRKNGRIINLASIAGQRGSVANSHYTTTKRGVEGFSRSIALELAPYNITVNCIAPGIIMTPIFDEKILQERGETWLKSIPLGRFGQPEDIAKAIMFLASEYAAYITGITLDVNGGMYLR